MPLEMKWNQRIGPPSLRHHVGKQDEQTDEYYMHIFSKKMPDLNWSNENMRADLFKMVMWWFRTWNRWI